MEACVDLNRGPWSIPWQPTCGGRDGVPQGLPVAGHLIGTPPRRFRWFTTEGLYYGYYRGGSESL
jgi:hypothetical protein